MSKKPRARAERRMQERVAKKRVHDLQRLAAMEIGGSAARPFEVSSSSVIAVKARSQPCPLCGGTLHFNEETAENVEGQRLRAAHLRCVQCGVPRTLWFKIGSPLPS